MKSVASRKAHTTMGDEKVPLILQSGQDWPDWLARISPTTYKHIVENKSKDFELPQHPNAYYREIEPVCWVWLSQYAGVEWARWLGTGEPPDSDGSPAPVFSRLLFSSSAAHWFSGFEGDDVRVVCDAVDDGFGNDFLVHAVIPFCWW